MKTKIGIIGSINTDIVCQTDKIPEVGETVIGNNFSTLHGGKGANEAVSAARLGANVNLIACVGDDNFSSLSLKNLRSEKVNLIGITALKNTKGGIANIVISNKNNQIIVVPGANEKLSPDLIRKNISQILECNIIGAQFEVPIESVLLTSQICKENNIKFVLNPSPLKKYPKELFNNSTFVIVNEVEISSISGYNQQNPFEVLNKYPNKLILTHGSKGCYFSNGSEIINVPAIKVDVIDTTGAGDTFLGSFMFAINNNLPIEKSIEFANICAGLKTTKLGAQTGMPTIKEVKNYIKKNKIQITI